MKTQTFKAQYELFEFNHYVNHEDKTVNVVDLVIESDDIDFIEISGVEANPKLSFVIEAREKLKNESIDFIFKK